MKRTTELTRALSAPPLATVDEDCRRRLRRRLTSGIAGSVVGMPPGWQVELTMPLLRRAMARPDRLTTPEEPFAWKPVFVRRSLGLAVVDACAKDRFRSPAEAVGTVAAEAVAKWERTGWRTFHWEPWFAGLADGARAVVLADALGWATALWASFDWDAFALLPQIGGADDRWICPAPRTVRLKGRSEMRVPLCAPSARARPHGRHVPEALVSVSGGCCEDGWAEELAFLALVAGLRSPSRPVPARVVGLWPDSGQRSALEIDEGSLVAAVDRVVATVSALAAASLAQCRN